MTPDARPFVLQVPEQALEDLRERLRRTRWPEAETVDRADGVLDWSQGPPLAYVRDLVEHWTHRVRLAPGRGGARRARPGADRGRRARPPRAARPLAATRRAPARRHARLAQLGARAAGGDGRARDPGDAGLPAFHVVAPSLPGYGFGARPTTTGWDVDRTADAWVELMARLGYDRFYAAGGAGAGASPPRSGTGTPTASRACTASPRTSWSPTCPASSARFSCEDFPPDNTGQVTVPSAVTISPADMEKVPRAWAEGRFTDLRSFTVAEHGGHFPMLEVPDSYARELRHAFALMPR